MFNIVTKRAQKSFYFLFLLAIFTLLFSKSIFFIFLTIALAGGFWYLFANVKREKHLFDDNALLSSVDGKVSEIKTYKDGNGDTRYTLSIQSSFTDAGLLSVPFIDAKISSFSRINGVRLHNNSTKKAYLNSSSKIIFKQNNNEVKINHIPQIYSYFTFFTNSRKENSLNISNTYGYMKFGKTEIDVAQNCRFAVNVGDQVYASKTLIGYFS
jgi:phosphatidylserine decarboxylase